MEGAKRIINFRHILIKNQRPSNGSLAPCCYDRHVRTDDDERKLLKKGDSASGESNDRLAKSEKRAESNLRGELYAEH